MSFLFSDILHGSLMTTGQSPNSVISSGSEHGLWSLIGLIQVSFCQPSLWALFPQLYKAGLSNTYFTELLRRLSSWLVYVKHLAQCIPYIGAVIANGPWSSSVWCNLFLIIHLNKLPTFCFPKIAQGSPIGHGVSQWPGIGFMGDLAFLLFSHIFSLSINSSNSSCSPFLTVEQTKSNYSPGVISVVTLFHPNPSPKADCAHSGFLLGTWFYGCFRSALINVSSLRNWSVAFISESQTTWHYALMVFTKWELKKHHMD